MLRDEWFRGQKSGSNNMVRVFYENPYFYTMNKKITIEDFSPYLFWDVDMDKFDLKKHKKQLIHKVLEYGMWKDWELIKELYGMEAIKETALTVRSLDAVTLAFVCNLFQIDKTEFRCYKHAQLYPTYWNS